jgi:hypothetical protein
VARGSLTLKIKRRIDHHFMDPTSDSLDEAMSSNEKNLAKVKNSRGMSARACSATAITWTLESSKTLSTHNASTKDTCDSQTITQTTDT